MKKHFIKKETKTKYEYLETVEVQNEIYIVGIEINTGKAAYFLLDDVKFIDENIIL